MVDVHKRVATPYAKLRPWKSCPGFDNAISSAAAFTSSSGFPGPSHRLAHWGIAYAAGPNYNKQWKAFDPVDLKRSLDTAHDAAKRALELVDGAELRRASSDPIR